MKKLLLISLLALAINSRAAVNPTNQMVTRSAYSLNVTQFDVGSFPITITNLDSSKVSNFPTNTVVQIINDYSATNIARISYPTNLSVLIPNFLLPYSFAITNAAFIFLPPINTSNLVYQECVIFVTNSSGTNISANVSVGIRTNGVFNVTNVTRFTFLNYGKVFTNCIAFPLW